MAKQITLEEALKLVEFEYVEYPTRPSEWRVCSVLGDVFNNVRGSVMGDVYGDVVYNVYGTVGGTINRRKWQYVETPQDKLKRLIDEGADREQLIEAVNQLEDN